jgi:hypothetical protein
MKNGFLMVAVVTGLMGAGCATTSAQEQRQAEQHQRNSDDAARNGQFGIAADEQRQAQQSQSKAVQKSLDEGKPVARVPTPRPPVLSAMTSITESQNPAGISLNSARSASPEPSRSETGVRHPTLCSPAGRRSPD